MWHFLAYFLVAIVVVILGLIKYARWHWGVLEKNGFTVVPPDHFLLGSALLTYQKPGGLLDIELTKKYGPVFGLYEGRDPQVIISDTELIRIITTRDAEYFDAKRQLDFGEPIFNELMDFLPGEKWKFVRGLFSPVINSSVRLKNAGPAMSEAVHDFISGLKEKIGESGKVEKFALNEGIYTMLTELIARSQFGITMGKGAGSANHRFVQIVRVIMSPPANEAPALASWVYAFPFIKRFLPNTMINPEPMKEFWDLMKQLMDIRRSQDRTGHFKDFLDCCVEWYDNLGSAEYKKYDVNEPTVGALAMGLFMAGQDQVSLIISVMVMYALENPQIEANIQEELDRVWKENGGKFDHEALSQLTYLSACATEATRLYPFFFRTERVCTKDWVDTSRGLRINKGTTVQIALWAANRNPEHFESPEEFRPERFLPGQKEKLHAYAFTSFGFGPRNCVGKKLAMELILTIAAHLLRELKFVKRNDSKLNFIPAGPFFGAHEPVYFDVVERRTTEE